MTVDKPRTVDIPALRRLWKQAFGDPDAFLDGFFCTGFSPDRCRCLWAQGQLAAALYWFDCGWQEKKLAYLYAVATDEAFRGRGLCRQLCQDTHRHLQSLGYAGAVLVPGSPELFSLYAKLGYRPFCPMETVTAQAGDTPLPLRAIDADTFAALRRQSLPANGVLQEGQTLSFLAAFAGFYTGEDALLCASREGDTLYIQEYLGDPGHLPGILAALGAKQGIARIPGGNAPTAMYRSLDGTDALPDYFGIPLN